MNTPFEKELIENIRSYIKRAKRGGTVAMSLANLKQCVSTPKTLAGAPNGPESYTVLFNRVAVENFGGFILGPEGNSMFS